MVVGCRLVVVNFPLGKEKGRERGREKGKKARRPGSRDKADVEYVESSCTHMTNDSARMSSRNGEFTSFGKGRFVSKPISEDS